MAFPWLFRGPHLLGKTVFGRFSWLFRGPHFGQILSALALEKSSEHRCPHRAIWATQIATKGGKWEGASRLKLPSGAYRDQSRFN